MLLGYLQEARLRPHQVAWFSERRRWTGSRRAKASLTEGTSDLRDRSTASLILLHEALLDSTAGIDALVLVVDCHHEGALPIYEAHHR